MPKSLFKNSWLRKPLQKCEKIYGYQADCNIHWILHRKIYIQSVKKLFEVSITYVFRYLSI